MASVSDGTDSATYYYLANSPLVGQIVFASNMTTRMTTTNQRKAKGSVLGNCHFVGQSDARNGTTTYTFNNMDQIASVTTPAPGTGQPAQTTTTYFDKMGRNIGTMLPDGTTTTNILLPTGQPSLTYGSRTYPVGYSYDAQERMITMTNWTNFAGGSGTGTRVTTWNYDSYRGFLTNKSYPDGNGTTYTNTAAGRLAGRGWARGTNTTYSYNTAGDLASVVYSDGTPGVTNAYDRLGRKTSVICGATTTSFVYDQANDVLGETNVGGILNGFGVTNGYDGYLRRGNTVALGSGVLRQAIYGYDGASRLATVSDGINSASNSYRCQLAAGVAACLQVEYGDANDHD